MTAAAESLSLISLKCASNVFDLSSGQIHASIRDQIVRGQILVLDLCRADPSFQNLLIVGGGIAGIAAGMVAVGKGKTVVIADRNHHLLSLQNQVSDRYIGPFMYEWPSSFSDDQSYPPINPPTLWAAPMAETPQWSSAAPLTAMAWANQVLNWLKQLPTGKKPVIWYGVDKNAIATFVKAFVAVSSASCVSAIEGHLVRPNLLFKGSQAGQQIQPHYVLLAAGMGTEDCKLYDADDKHRQNGIDVCSPAFWAPDKLRSSGAAYEEIAIFGGGDGALQDVLRALTRFDHPLQFMEELCSKRSISRDFQRLMPHLLALESQNRLLDIWTQASDKAAHLDNTCRSLAQKLAAKRSIRRAVLANLRDGSGIVHHIVRESHFTKAYLLNRLLVHLVHACMPKRYGKQWWNKRSRMDYRLHMDTTVEQVFPKTLSSPARVTIKPAGGKAVMLQPHQFAVRYGIVKDSVAGEQILAEAQMVQISAIDRGDRTVLRYIPLPFVVPGP